LLWECNAAFVCARVRWHNLLPVTQT
jgi:hypothetical protein